MLTKHGRGPETRTKNQGRCLTCKQVITSLYRHDYRICKCGAIAVDGGNDYHRRSGPDNFDPNFKPEPLKGTLNGKLAGVIAGHLRRNVEAFKNGQYSRELEEKNLVRVLNEVIRDLGLAHLYE